ncbi:MAG: CDP-glucose 4,6-dehydratase [bacterium]|nr:CDP-glucose 4,6-dehydratase [bacterium]
MKQDVKRRSNIVSKLNTEFFQGKNVLVTGHTGFKGAWMCHMLKQFGANVTGYALEPMKPYSLFDIAKVKEGMNSVIGEIQDYQKLLSVFQEKKPEIVFHLAAQPIVRESYREPRYTYETNVMGTVNVLECIRNTPEVRSFVNITTDKVYLNNEWEWGYREIDPLDGYDVYSNSKSCSELVTACYNRAFFKAREISISTVRAGNVIGGGDFAKDRIIPDCVRAALDKQDIVIRNLHATRPYQHVLEPLYVYLLVAQKQYENPTLAGAYNVGPEDCDCVENQKLVTLFVKQWGQGLKWIDRSDNGPHEANFLKLDSSKLKYSFGWHPHCTIADAVEMVIEWTKEWDAKNDVRNCMNRQIKRFF